MVSSCTYLLYSLYSFVLTSVYTQILNLSSGLGHFSLISILQHGLFDDLLTGLENIFVEEFYTLNLKKFIFKTLD